MWEIEEYQSGLPHLAKEWGEMGAGYRKL